ncbi:periplasmic heavy metal sensor [Polymorphobacter sp.]|uniref:periplasmic heavy metal sensor n=1 Tax=Polymorphobacter sp. TaxID=1909290 RepID=UPI003F72CFC8
MSKLMRAATFGLLIVASPVLAQTPPPAATTASPEAGKAQGQMRGKMGGRMFSSLSEAGRATMREAMQASRQGNDRTAVKAARDRMLTLLEADRLDTAALKRAMDEERTLAATSHERRQTAMLNAFTKLSVADRKAFVTEARQLRDKMQDRMQGERGERLKRWRERRGGGAGGQL